MSHPSILKERSPLHQLNTNSQGIHKSPVTYTDQRIQEIKRKYDTPNKRSHDQHSIENMSSELAKKDVNKFASLATTNEKQAKKTFCDRSITYNSVGSHQLGSKQNDKGKCPQISKFGLAQQPKINHFSTLQNFCIKPTLSTKLKVYQTDQNFFKPINKPEPQLINGIRCKDSYTKLNRRQFQDPRIESIDKINSKIKRILDCIDDCEKEQMRSSAYKRSRVSVDKKITASILGRSIISNNQIRHSPNADLQQTKILQKKQFYQQSPSKYQAEDHKNIITDIIPSLTQMRSSHCNNQFSQYLASYKNQLRQRQNGDLRHSVTRFEKVPPRSISCFNKLREFGLQPKPEGIEMDPKMDQIQHQITKFQQKIAELQQQKRKLNIRFKPFHYQSSPIKKLNTSYHIQASNPYNLPLKRLQSDVEFKHKQPLKPCQNKNQQRLFDRIVVKQVQVQNDTQNQGVLPTQMQKLKSYDNLELRKKIGERMEQRRKRIQMFHDDLKNEKKGTSTTHLIKVLCQQVRYDEQLRNSKNWLSQCNNKQKLATLQLVLRSRGVSLSLEQIDHEFNTLRQDETDPFFSFREEKFTIESVAENYLRCVQHWNNNVLHKWNKQQLFNQQNFAGNFFNKNEILLEDFVRLLNTQGGNFYRNRDLYLIYERIKTALGKQERQKLNFEDLSKIFS